MTHKYTFLLPAFKVKFFKDALLSIKNQTYTDFLCIVSDDCSPEDLKSIFGKTVGDDSRFTYRRNKENMGSKSLVSHWNLLVDMCETDYLVMASDDDKYDEHFLEEIDKLAIKYSDVGIIRARIRRFDEDGNLLIYDNIYPEYEDCIDSCLRLYSKGYIHCMQNNVFRTELLRQVGKCVDFPVAWFSDDATIMACSINGIANTQELLFNYQNSSLQISNELKTPRPVCIKKIKAAAQFNLWVDNVFTSLSIKDTSNIEQIAEVKKKAKNRAMSNAILYLSNLTITQRIRLFPLVLKSHVIPIFFYIKMCIYAIIHPVKQ